MKIPICKRDSASSENSRDTVPLIQIWTLCPWRYAAVANMTRLLAKISPSLSFSMAMGPGNPLLKYNAKGAQETPLLKYNAKGAVSRN